MLKKMPKFFRIPVYILSNLKKIWFTFMNYQNMDPDQTYLFFRFFFYTKTCIKGPLKNRQNKDLNDRW